MKKIVLLLMLFCAFVLADTLEQIKKSGVLRVGVREGRPPFSKLVDGKFEGFEVDLANKIAHNLFGQKEGKVEFIGVSAAQRIPFLQENKVDIIIATLTITDKRKELVDFATPYFSVNIGVLAGKNRGITNLLSLKDKTLLVQKDSTSEDYFKDKGVLISHCDNAAICYKMLKEGKGDGFADDNLIVLAYPIIDNDVSVAIKNLGKPDFLAVAVQKGNKTLLEFINNQMITLSKDGFFKKSYQETFEPFYKGAADKKYFLLDDIYSFFG